MNHTTVGFAIFLVGCLAFALGCLGGKSDSKALMLFCAFLAFGITFVVPVVMILMTYFPGKW